MNYVQLVLAEATLQQLTMQVIGDDGTVDYKGSDCCLAMEAVDACDEMTVVFWNKFKRVGVMLVVNGLAEDERIADCAGWPQDCLDTYFPPE